MTNTGTIKGSVKDRHGAVQIGAEIQVVGTERSGVSGLDGNYTIDNVPAGEQSVTASMVLAKDTKDADVPADGTVIVDFVLNPLHP